MKNEVSKWDFILKTYIKYDSIYIKHIIYNDIKEEGQNYSKKKQDMVSGGDLSLDGEGDPEAGDLQRWYCLLYTSDAADE